MSEAQRAKLVAQLTKKCAALYDARTSAARRRDLSLEVSFIRARLGAPNIDTLYRASESVEEC
jgi:hypothetical protein